MNPSIQAIGARAYRALVRSDGVALPLPAFPRASYLDADGELIWIGVGVTVTHPRAVMLDRPWCADAGPQRFELRDTRPCRPSVPAWPREYAARVAAADTVYLDTRFAEVCRMMIDDVLGGAEPQGLGAALAGEALAFPLDLGVRHFERLALAYRANDPEGVGEAALPLLGFGPGLTPSGDDFVGASLFGRRLRDPARFVAPAGPWLATVEGLIAAARDAGHEISAALFADLARGESFASLHRLGLCIAACLDESAGSRADVATAARELVSIGRSSGWDMLAGFITGLTGQSFCLK
ncbi:hypothetical protein PTE30175_01097 [Pandoraea terrae]|uniref:DUF2877 domain-containing protein n=1 Tax=Pandoraea terrae TaxID=1537710 RepID=A0A5E4T5F0_9BURK|nr:DUF2877 domain-containing protein [Pandoraea terrae]VVD81684.1 hypothetical protein PTE30175_01097 [Pandoraea terrae]